MLYDVDVITWLRREHHILGVLSGTLPQIPQQNVFLGLPLELMPEEARLLTEKWVAYIVNDANRHHNWKVLSKPEDRRSFEAMLQTQGLEAADLAARKKQASKEHAVQRGSLAKSQKATERPGDRSILALDDQLESSFAQEPESPKETLDRKANSGNVEQAWAVTPTTSFPLLPKPAAESASALPKVREASYALFKHLHECGYYLSPGLRFGCQFMAYPGDPLRYHSHFLAVSADWDEEIDLLDVVGGGRLGTGVKKGFLLGGRQPMPAGTQSTRAFCIEWGGM